MRERADEKLIDEGEGVAEERVEQATGKGKDEVVEEGDDQMEEDVDVNTND